MSLRALAYADWRAVVNDVHAILRSPRRIALWLVYAVLLATFVWGRTSRARGAVPTDSAGAHSADYLMCALLGTLVFSFTTGWGAVGIFRSRVEARFIIGSPLAAPLAIAYLQTREAFGQGLRLVSSLIYLLLVFTPRGVSVGAAFSDIALVMAVVGAGAAIVVPRRLLRGRASRVCMVAGIPLVIVAIMPALRDAVIQLHVPDPLGAFVLAQIPAWHPGTVLLEPRPVWLLAALALAGSGIGTLAAAGRDAYPELYALSMARIDAPGRLERRRSAGAVRRLSRATPAFIAPLTPLLTGAAAFLWKSGVEFARGTSVSWIAGGAVMWGVAGFGVARLAQTDDGETFGLIAAGVAGLLLLIGPAATNGLAQDLRRPLFWLAPVPFFERLCALGLAQIWRTLLTLEIVAAGLAAGGGSVRDVLVFALGLPALVALLAGIGFAVFALFPSPADQRGPVALLRLSVSVLLLVPPLLLEGVGSAAFGAPLTALCAAVLVALGEAAALVGIAAGRLDGRMDRLPG